MTTEELVSLKRLVEFYEDNDKLLRADDLDNVKAIIKDNTEEEFEETEERSCVKCGKTSGLIEEEDMCYTCAEERGRV